MDVRMITGNRWFYPSILAIICGGMSFLFMTVSKGSDSDNKGRDLVRAADSVVIDIDGNVYRTVTIGDQAWLGENLRVTRYRNGSVIPYVVDDSLWSVLTSGAYCWGSEDTASYKATYGALYNFYAVNDSCGLCPKGWHVATEAEWLNMEAYLGGPAAAGGKAKESGTVHWNRPNVGATNESGFTGLPAGGRGRVGGPGEIGNYATWWSATAHDSAYAWHWGLYTGNAKVRSNPGHKASGFSVRCVKD
jgi:uncharacterized protein (TIGR02145 family)